MVNCRSQPAARARLADAAGRFIAVHTGHAEVEEDEIGLEARKRLQSRDRDPATGDIHRRGECLQKHRETVGDIPVVVDDEDPVRDCRRFRSCLFNRFIDGAMFDHGPAHDKCRAALPTFTTCVDRTAM